MIWYVATALALDADGLLARAQGLSAAERSQEGWNAAVEALLLDPAVEGGPAIYRGVCEAAGLGARCAAEVKVAPAPWAAEMAALGNDIARQESLKATSKAIQDGWPRHPELFTPLWPETGGFLALKVTQGQVVDRVRRRLGDADAGLAWRSWMLLRLDPDAAGDAARRLRELGEGEVPARAPWNGAQRLAFARTLTATPALPADLYPTERRDVATHLAAELARSNRTAEMASIWAEFSGSADAAYALVYSAPPDAAVAASCRPLTRDLAVGGPLRTKLGADAFVARSTAMASEGRLGEALGWRLVAHALTPVDDGQTEVLRKAAAADIAMARHRWAHKADPTFGGILGAARQSTFVDSLRAVAQANDALIVLAATATRGGSLRAADVSAWLAVWGEVAEATARPAEARAAWTAATLVDPSAPGLVWALRGNAEERDGDREAAFGSYSKALARGQGVEAEAQRTYRGPGEWRAAAVALGG